MPKIIAMVAACLAGMPALVGAQPASNTPVASIVSSPPLAGTWTLVAADVIHPDGTQARDYGAAPKGLLIIDAAGRYSLQIFKAERPRFASGDKANATLAEYQSAVQGSSTHLGTLNVDPAAGTLTFHIQSASFPNWEGTDQTRRYELRHDELSYRVPPRPNGDTPVSIWRRVE